MARLFGNSASITRDYPGKYTILMQARDGAVRTAIYRSIDAPHRWIVDFEGWPRDSFRLFEDAKMHAWVLCKKISENRTLVGG
jgi:hypothetical protein